MGKRFDGDANDNDRYTDSDSDSDSEDFDTYDKEPFADAALLNASRTIDRLYRVAFKIRNPANRSGFTKARNYKQIDAESGKDLMQVFHDFDVKHVKEEQAKTSHVPLWSIVWLGPSLNGDGNSNNGAPIESESRLLHKTPVHLSCINLPNRRRLDRRRRN